MTSCNASPTLLAVGPWEWGEFAAVRRELDPERRWPTATSLAAAVERISGLDAPPELLLLAQPRPGCDQQDTVDRLRSAAPLTRIVAVAGAWCEGELRTGRPLAGVVRLYWHELAAWWRDALARLAAGAAPPWSAPLTAPRAPADLPQTAQHVAAGNRLLAVDACDFAVFEAVDYALKAVGWQCVWQPCHRPKLWQKGAGPPPDAGLWDGGQLDAAELAQLNRFAARLAPHQAPVIALLDFPRAEYIDQAHRAGAAAVLGKPYVLHLLVDELNASTATALN